MSTGTGVMANESARQLGYEDYADMRRCVRALAAILDPGDPEHRALMAELDASGLCAPHKGDLLRLTERARAKAGYFGEQPRRRR